MSTYVQVGLVGLINGVSMLALKVRTGLLERLHKSLLQLGQPLAPARDALHGRDKSFKQLMQTQTTVRLLHYTCLRSAAAKQGLHHNNSCDVASFTSLEGVGKLLPHQVWWNHYYTS